MRTSTTMTVILSAPPAVSAAETRLSAACCGVALETASDSISLSGTMLERPSEQRMTRSPLDTSMEK